ncbi:MAG TPA: HAMP domain-containing sensor histidine kinase [Methylibium sp.]|uniref:sensor histidine kinase n=1 Tax=Methylibium sp. TaxID=2067992 RepID=UPI002DB6705B|nr:HAMP domain-containing sensor histidine kinase [Methylibium sp.]HEU4459770.1 HAMP domain-containing sensor histidine kinase [Methylibium sp.]
MKTLYLRIWLTVVAALLLFALVSGWLVQRNIEHERARYAAATSDRLAAWAELLQGALPPPEADEAEQRRELLEWSARLRLALALEDVAGKRIATAPMYARLTGEPPDASAAEAPPDAVDPAGRAAPPAEDRPLRSLNPGERRTPQRVAMSDGRTLLVVRGGGPRRPDGGGRGLPESPPFFMRGIGVVITLGVLFVAVAAGAYPVVRRLTRRLEALKQGVEDFGAGELTRRVDASGRDEVAAVAASFNAAAERVQTLLASHRSLLANASHELRSPLARLKMALAMLETAPAAQQPRLKQEIERNIGELDALVEEVLLASRLDARQNLSAQAAEAPRDPVDLLALAAEEAARVDALLEAPDARLPATLPGDERLLRRALRNLLENARRYGGSEAPVLQLQRAGERAEIRVHDRGPGVPEDQRERIFEPFYRLPGHAEHEGGVGLGLSLVRQIARHHGGAVWCEPREHGGSCFVLALPLRAAG